MFKKQFKFYKMEQVLWKINSRYAVVSCFSQKGSLWVEKMISPGDMDANWINYISNLFREKLLENNVPIVNPYRSYIRDKYSIQVSKYIGPDVEKYFSLNRGNSKNQFSAIEKIIYAIKNILTHNSLEVGIDARLSNFCINGKGEVYYVDTFPPLIKIDNEYIVHFPNPKDEKIIQAELFRKFHPMGIMRRLRFSILEHSDEITEKDILLAVSAVLGQSFSISLEEYFNNLPHNSDNKIVEVIESLETDSIREVALNKAINLSAIDKQKLLTDVFELSSSFCPLMISQSERIERLKKC